MAENMLLPIELTKILYSEWQGQLEIVNDEDQLYGKSLNGPCKVTFKNGNKYEGQFKNGLLHGKGTFTWANGIVYEGEFKYNKLEGYGVYHWPDGAIYQGQVQNGLRHGQGKLTLDMCTYEGEWKNGHRDGHGKITFSNGGVYDGQFKNGVKSGRGRMYYPSGNFYDGQWQQDAKNGQGTMRWMDSHQKYTGEWLNNLQHGIGTHIWLDGRGEGKYMRNRYQGQWKAGLRDGLGVFYYANGSKYEGEWVQNMKQGTALFTNEFGNVERTEFSKDRLIKQEEKSSTRTDQKSKSTFVFNNKQIQTNPYTKMLSVRQLYLPQNPELEQLYNLLLRSNSQLKGWYKSLSTIYDSKSQLTFSLNLEGIWKIARNLKVLGKISLARINRMLAQSKLNLRNYIHTIQNIEERIPVSDVEYYVQSTNIYNLVDSLDRLSNNQNSIPELTQCTSIHDGQKVILLRDFVFVLLIIAYMLDNSVPPHKSLQKCLQRIGPTLDSMMKIERKNTIQSKSQNVSTVSKTQKSIPSYARTINTNLFRQLTQRSKNKFKHNLEDRSIQFIKLIQIFKQADLFNDSSDPSMLQRFLDKNMDAEFLLSPPRFDTKLNPKFSNARQYQLIQFQFVELIFYYLIKKLPSTKQTEENKQKYNEFINKITDASQRIEWNRLNRIHQNRDIRVNISPKLKQKQKLQENRNKINKIKEQQNTLMMQRQRQDRERMLMQGNDVNIHSEQFESEEDQYSDY